MNDRTLIHQIQKGKKELLAEVTQRYYGDIYRFCVYLTGNVQDAADLTQETFCKFIRYVDSYRCRNSCLRIVKFSVISDAQVGCNGEERQISMPAGIKAYLYAIARNACMDYFRGQRTHVPLEEMPQAAGAEKGYVRAELESDLFMQMQKISGEQREAILLYYYEELKLKDIARITGAPLSTVKSRIRQGLAKLKKLCEEEGICL